MGTLLLILGIGTAGAAPATAGRLSIKSLVDIRHPSSEAFSPDGQSIAFVWDRGGVQDVYVVGTKDAEPRALTHHDTALSGGLFWSQDGQTIYFEYRGDLWGVAARGDQPAQPVWTTPEVESGMSLSHDGKRVAFSRNGDLWVRSLLDGTETRLTSTEENESNPDWSPDDRHVAFQVVTSTPKEDSPEYSGAKLAFRYAEGFSIHVGVVSVDGGPVVSVARSDGADTSPRWLDAKHLTLQRVSADLKSREVVVWDATTGQARTLSRDEDPKFWSLEFLGAEPVPSPDGRSVAFISDRDGWDHLYVATLSGEVRQITKGAFEVSRPAWSPDSRRIAVDTNEGSNPGARQLVVVDADAASPPLRITQGRGTNIRGTWSPDGRRLLFQHTDPRNSADLFITDVQASAVVHRLTDSMPKGVDRSSLIEPSLVHYKAPDGESVPAYLFVAPNLDRRTRHPAIVWVHGDGITQNFDGWHTRRDYAIYYSLHQYLAQKGYVVLAVDYRGSIGYGRAWRQGHYRDLGGKDYFDIASGVDYLKTLGFVDTGRVGVWGLSYGGFMALQALTVTPELFRCGIDVAGVEDWRDWYHDPDGPWIRARLGRPEEEGELYRKTSPIHSIDKMVRPLLVMHGTADVNVPFVESVRLIDVALKAGKDVDFVMYPGEFHYFHRAHVLRDAWMRAERFFDTHLRP